MTTPSWRPGPLPPDAISVVRAELTTLVEEIVAAVRRENPVYAEVLGGPDGIGIRLGIEQAVRTFLDAAERGDDAASGASEAGELWRRLGEAEYQQGRGLDALRTAFRTGTRAAWRGAADLAAAAGISASLVITLAEAIFVYTDELATDVVEGYLRAQSDAAGEQERRRRRLATLLLDASAAGPDPETLERAAALARWSVPRTLAVLAIAADSPVALTRRLDVDALAGADAEGAWLIVPDPDGPGRPRRLEHAAAATGVATALGPTVPPAEARRSLEWARATLGLAARGAIPPGAPARASENLAALVVLGDGDLAAAILERRLGALAGLGGADRERLLETLEAWLDHQRHTPAIAAALHVHPQTVRYRMRRLHELLGDGLDTPDGRFELALALRARRGLSPAQPG